MYIKIWSPGPTYTKILLENKKTGMTQKLMQNTVQEIV